MLKCSSTIQLSKKNKNKNGIMAIWLLLYPTNIVKPFKKYNFHKAFRKRKDSLKVMISPLSWLCLRVVGYLLVWHPRSWKMWYPTRHHMDCSKGSLSTFKNSKPNLGPFIYWVRVKLRPRTEPKMLAPI